MKRQRLSLALSKKVKTPDSQGINEERKPDPVFGRNSPVVDGQAVTQQATIRNHAPSNRHTLPSQVPFTPVAATTSNRGNSPTNKTKSKTPDGVTHSHQQHIAPKKDASTISSSAQKSSSVLSLLRGKPAIQTTACPMCGDSVPLSGINAHLDKECRGMESTESGLAETDSTTSGKGEEGSVVQGKRKRSHGKGVKKETTPETKAGDWREINTSYEPWSCFRFLTSLSFRPYTMPNAANALEATVYVDLTPAPRPKYKRKTQATVSEEITTLDETQTCDDHTDGVVEDKSEITPSEYNKQDGPPTRNDAALAGVLDLNDSGVALCEEPPEVETTSVNDTLILETAVDVEYDENTPACEATTIDVTETRVGVGVKNEGESITEEGDDGAEKPKWQAYYVRNFKFVVNEIRDSRECTHLLSDEDRGVLDSLEGLSEGAQKLYVRLFQRKRNWFRLTRLKYDDIDLGPAVEELANCCLVESASGVMGLDDALNTLLLADVIDLVQRHRVLVDRPPNGQPKKADYIAALLTHCRQQRSLFSADDKAAILLQHALQKLEPCVRLTESPRWLFDRCLLLFFLNTEHNQNSLSTLFLSDVGKRSFASYRVLRSIADTAGNHSTLPTAPIQITTHVSTAPSGEETDVWSQTKLGQDEGSVGMDTGSSDGGDVCTLALPVPLFDTREDLVSYQQALFDEFQMQEAMAEGDYDRAEAFYEIAHGEYTKLMARLEAGEQPSWTARPVHLRRYTCARVHVRMVADRTVRLETQRLFEESVALHRTLLSTPLLDPAARGRLWNRLALDLEHLKLVDEAAAACEEALADQHVRTAHRLQLVKRIRRLARGNKPMCPITKRRLLLSLPALPRAPPIATINGYVIDDPTVGMKSVFITDNGTRLASVEDIALDYYVAKSGQGWQGLHCENSVFMALFTLLFWDVLFAPVKDAFLTAYQTSPLDLTTDDFFLNRKELITERLSYIGGASGDELHAVVGSAWEQHCGTVALGLGPNWEKLPIATLQAVAVCSGGRLLQAVCEALCRDYRHWHGGLPDLTMWNLSERRAKFVEVKSPNDRMSEQQEVWADLFLAVGADYQLCRVNVTNARKIPSLPSTPPPTTG